VSLYEASVVELVGCVCYGGVDTTLCETEIWGGERKQASKGNGCEGDGMQIKVMQSKEFLSVSKPS